MQLTPQRQNFIEKIIRGADGRLVKATFCIYEHGGRIKARIVSTEFIKEVKNEILCLSTALKNSNYTEVVFKTKTVSPYFNNSLIYTSGSKPRAPTI